MDKLALYIKKLLHEAADMNNLHVMPDLMTSHARPDRASYTEQIPGQAGNDRTVKPGMTDGQAGKDRKVKPGRTDGQAGNFMDRVIKGGIDRAVCFSNWLVYMPARCPALLIDFNRHDDKKLCFSHGDEEKLAKKLEKV